MTTANGKGVSVLDFLCLSQSKEMMRAVLNHFVETNPGAVDKIRSVVIDKDYTEWAVLLEVFPSTDVVLCQFHVLKWFQFVVTAPKYGISGAVRDEVVKILRAMVYAVSDDDFKHQQLLLSSVLGGERYAAFHAYMTDRWYNIIAMWSYAGRGKIFTAANTTSNRLESYWHQYKETLAKKQRIDLCVQAIFVHGTTVLRREKRLFADFKKKTSLHTNVDKYLWPILVELCVYAADLVKGQWNKYISTAASYKTIHSDGFKHIVCVTGVRSINVTVDAESWSCSCHFHLGSGLPCRHLLFVAREVCGEVAAPIAMIHRRWLMSDAATLLCELTTAIDELSTLRLSSLALDMASLSLDGDLDSSTTAPLPPPSVTRRAVAHLTLRRNEPSDQVVLNDLQKRNHALSLSDRVVQYLMAQGTSRYNELAADWEDTIVAKLSEWRGLEAASEAEVTRPTQVMDDPELNAAFAEQELLQTLEQVGVSEANERVFEEDLLGDDVSCSQLSPDVPAVVHSPFLDASFCTLLTGSVCEDDSETLAAIEQTLQDAVVYNLSRTRVSPLEELVRACDLDDDVVTGDAETQVSDGPVLSSSSMASTMVSSQPPMEGPVQVSAGKGIRANEETPSRNTRGAVKRRATASDDGQVKCRAIETEDSAKLSKITFPTVMRQGVTRQTKQASSVTGRLAPVNQNSDCPVQLADCLLTLNHSCVDDAVRLHSQYPILFDDQGLKNRSATVKRYTIDPARFRVNFSVPSGIVHALRTGIDLRRQDDAFPLPRLGGEDGSQSQSSEPTLTEQYVAMMTTKTRGFSE